MKKPSAGILVYKIGDSGNLMVLLAHPGGPYWSRKDLGVWSVPKGQYEPPEEPFAAARREFHEEIGQAPPQGEYIDLGQFKRNDGKLISAWAVKGDVDTSSVFSNSVEIEWPTPNGD